MQIRLVATVINTAHPDRLADFYQQLLGLPRLMDEPDWVVLRAGPDSHALSFQRDPTVERPEWPNRVGRPRVTVHLDLVVDDLDAATSHAQECGATRATIQHNETAGERVMIDPDGNPFCLIVR